MVTSPFPRREKDAFFNDNPTHMKPTLRTFLVVLLFMVSLLIVSYWLAPTEPTNAQAQEATIPVCGAD